MNKTTSYDNYAISNFRDCPRKFYYRIERQLVKVGSKALAPEFGTALHIALETYYANNMTEASKEQSLLDFVGYYGPIYVASNGAEIDDKRTPEKGLDLLLRYYSHYGIEPFEPIATEVGGVIELRRDLLYTTRIDLAAQWLSPPGVYGFDHKSTSVMDGIMVKPNNQFTGYISTLMETYENVLGFQMNLIGVFKTDKQKDRYTGKMEPREIFQRISTTRTSKEIAMWKCEILQTVDLIDSCRDMGVWPRWDKCQPYRNARCPYHDLCITQDDEMIERLIELGAYQVEEWSAYKNDNDTEVI